VNQRGVVTALVLGSLVAACSGRSSPTPVASPTATATPREWKPFEISINTHASVSANAHGGEPGRDTSSRQAQTNSAGAEQLGSCDGRRSRADALARSEAQDQRTWAAALLLQAESRANGGHYVEEPCFLKRGHDTAAEAEARAESTLQVRFSEDAADTPYEIRLKTVWIGQPADGLRYSTQLVDSSGKVVAEGPNWGHQVVAAANAAYTIAVSLLSNVIDRGACCSKAIAGSVRSEVEIIRVPSLAYGLGMIQAAPADRATEVKPFIFGGELVEEGYEAVGALMFEQEVECSGALIGSKTVLTAAHCIYDRPRELLERMSFRLGNNAYVPSTSRAVASTLYPTPANAQPGLSYVHSSRLPRNDIALVYLDQPASDVTPFRVHEGQPTLDSVQQEQTRLDFVGFGFNLVERSKSGIGKKRHVLMPIKGLEERWIRYGDGQGGTCYGDSGGPAFLLVEKKGQQPRLVLVGVTSAGPIGCRGSAYDTRVDEFAAWINAPGRIH
jgi:hypothetical protein